MAKFIIDDNLVKVLKSMILGGRFDYKINEINKILNALAGLSAYPEPAKQEKPEEVKECECESTEEVCS